MFTKTDINVRQQSIVVLSLRYRTVAANHFFFVLKTSFYKGAAIPLLLIEFDDGYCGFYHL